MADEKRQLILDLLARNKMSGDTASASRDLDRVGTAADVAGKKTDKFTKSTDSAGKGAKALSTEAREAARRITSLDAEIENVSGSIRTMTNALADADGASARLDISKGIRKAQADLKRLTSARGSIADSILPELTPADTAKWSQRISTGLKGALSTAGSSGLAGAGAALVGAALLPTIGGAIAGAVIGGVGAGGLIGGVALVAKDPQVSSYAKSIGQKFMKDVNAEAKDAFLKPVLGSLAQLEAAAGRAAPKIGKIFDNTAPSLNKFTGSLIKAGDILLDSFVGASSKAGPVLDAFGRIVTSTASTIGKFIDSLADNSEEGAAALDDLNGALQNIITIAGSVVNALAEIKGGLESVDDQIDKGRGWLEDHVGWLDLTADGYKKGSKAAQLYRDGVIGVNGSVNDYNAYISGAVDSTTGLEKGHDAAARAARGQRDALTELSNELRAQVDPAFALLNAQDKVRDGQDKLSEATKKYGSKSQEARAAARDLALAALDLQGKAGSLAGTFDGNLTPAMRNTLRAAGLTDDQIEAIVAEFKRAKKAGDDYAKTYRAKVITDYISRYSSIVSSSAQDAYEAEKKKINKRASGGPVSRGTPYLVGENGPEVVVPQAAGRVLSAASTRGMARSGAAPATGGWPSGGMVARVELVGAEEFRVFFRKMVRTMNILPETSSVAA
jgi:hypothetical protein